ncbi:protein AMBP-like isoform X3 [Etheostoma cragini]|uniref:protein AMBP-like isoform X3 n=1 Tax=Etheostoma cragini TaxID=417921 RepID=UPI00155DFB1F|nr:protein AMBP-like isoform X3 [Etheostoma cragini]
MGWSPLLLLQTWRIHLCSTLLCSMLQRSVKKHQKQTAHVGDKFHVTSSTPPQRAASFSPMEGVGATKTTFKLRKSVCRDVTLKRCVNKYHQRTARRVTGFSHVTSTTPPQRAASFSPMEGVGATITTLKLRKSVCRDVTLNVCEQAPEPGPCEAAIPRYFYNSSSMSCQLFIYGGCQGNQNNFETEKECMQRCHTEGVCVKAPEIGPCKVYIPRYFYNSYSKSCQLFIYGGCGGNQNNFETEKECMQRCRTE